MVFDRSPANIDRLVRALAPLEPYLRGAPRGLAFVLDAPTISRGLNCVTLDKLIDLKRAAGRPKDHEILAELEALRQEH